MANQSRNCLTILIGISSFAADNFRAISGGLDNNRIKFEGSNTIFIFGQNNVGKSTFLLAYDFFFNERTPSLEDLYKRDTSKAIDFELELGVDDVDLRFIEEKKIQSFRKYLAPSSTIRIKRSYSFSNDGKAKLNKAKDLTWNPSTQNWDETAFGTIVYIPGKLTMGFRGKLTSRLAGERE